MREVASGVKVNGAFPSSLGSHVVFGRAAANRERLVMSLQTSDGGRSRDQLWGRRDRRPRPGQIKECRNCVGRCSVSIGQWPLIAGPLHHLALGAGFCFKSLDRDGTRWDAMETNLMRTMHVQHNQRTTSAHRTKHCN
jgi:hypothetical protein